MRRVDPAYPDLLPITHVVRPGYIPGDRVELDPIRMSIVWKDAPRRTLPSTESIPRDPVRAIVFSRVAHKRPNTLSCLLERGSSIMLVMDEPDLSPSDLGLDTITNGHRITPILPVLPSPLANGFNPLHKWRDFEWGAILGLFPFPGAGSEVDQRIEALNDAGARFAVVAPLLLTPKDRHRILEGCEGTGHEDRMENALFHADVSRGLHAIERQAGIALAKVGMHAWVTGRGPRGCHPSAVRTSQRLRLWARRLDQSREESSWGWRLRRAASALELLDNDPKILAGEDNLRVIPGFDPWVESFTRALWQGGEPLESAWKAWSGLGSDT